MVALRHIVSRRGHEEASEGLVMFSFDLDVSYTCALSVSKLIELLSHLIWYFSVDIQLINNFKINTDKYKVLD